MSIRLAALLTVVLVAPAQAATISSQGGTITLDAAGDPSLRTKLAWIPGPCEYAIKEGDDGPRSVMGDAAGCVLTDLTSTTPGPGCHWTDSAHPMFVNTGKPYLGIVCGATGVTHVHVQGGPGNDELRFEPSYAFGGRTTVALGAGYDKLEAEDGAKQEIDCGGGEDETREDPGDVSRDCESGNAIHDGPAPGERAGLVARRGDTVVADLGGLRPNDVGRIPVTVWASDRSGSGLAFSTTAHAPLGVGDGCSAVNGIGPGPLIPFCPFTGVRALEIRGPDRPDPLVLEVNLNPQEAGHVVPPIATTIRAGKGLSTIDVADGLPQHVDCGAGLDRVRSDPKDVVEGNCERSTGGATMKPGKLGRVLPRAKAKSGRLEGRSGQAALVDVACPASAKDGCGGTLEVVFSGRPRLRFGATDYWVPAGRATPVTVVLGVDTGSFRADNEGPLSRRFFSELGRRGRLGLRVSAVRGPARRTTSVRATR